MENKKLKIIELFAGYSSQAQALKNIGLEIDEDNSFIVEWQTFASIANANLHSIEKFEKAKENFSKYDLEKLKELLRNFTLSPETKKIKETGNYELLNIDKIKKEDAVIILAAMKARNNLGSIMDVKFDKETNSFKHGTLTRAAHNDFDLLTYSFPCQDLSLAGKQKGIKEGTRSGLLFQVERLLNEGLRPKVLLMENVKNLVGKNHKPDFDIWVKKLEELGYTNSWFIMNAKDYGVPQNRERVFMISTLDGRKFEQPTKIILEKRLKDYLEPKVDESYYLSDEHIQKIIAWKAQEKPLQKVMGGGFDYWSDNHKVRRWY